MQTAVEKKKKRNPRFKEDNTCGFRFNFQTGKLKHLKGICFTLQVLWSFKRSFNLQMGEREH